ncbi:MAG: hypothetical protein CVU11_15675 [Bacteroidetes bacterium HGW-Bacteroidetes-6]|jgi:hypothetical protein|nr:MAG: hypothetical protein CVU11_15675 [Bacteroidetes bacterium HGW-Bacteroidetes-6]
MTGNAENKLSMVHTALGTCDKAAAILQTIPALWNTYQTAVAKAEVVEDYVQNQIRRIDGITIDKRKSRMKLINYVMVASGLVRAYANDSDNDTLTNEVKVSRSKLQHMRDEVMFDKAKVVIDIALSMQTLIAPYGLTPTIAANMQTALDDYHTRLQSTTQARAEKKYYTRQVNVLINELVALLRNNLDVNMEVLMMSHPEVVEKYRNSRVIYDYSTGRKKKVIEEEDASVLSGTVTDVDGFPLADARVVIEGTSIHTTTDADGEYLIDSVPAGKYNLVISIAGYKEVRENQMEIAAGGDLVKDFVMEVE